MNWRLLIRYAEYIRRLADVVILVCRGGREEAEKAFEAFCIGMDHYTCETERFFDFTPAIRSLKYLITGMKK